MVEEVDKKSKFKRIGRRTCPDFLTKLVAILQVESPDIIRWNSGKIILQNPRKLVAEVLKKYFRHANYHSFTRQLNYFGFRKTDGKGKMEPCTYTNEDLNGADLEAILDVKRKTKGTEEDLAILRSIDPSLTKEIYGTPKSSKSSQSAEYEIADSFPDFAPPGNEACTSFRQGIYPSQGVEFWKPSHAAQGCSQPQSEQNQQKPPNAVKDCGFCQMKGISHPTPDHVSAQCGMTYEIPKTNLDDLIKLCEQHFEVPKGPLVHSSQSLESTQSLSCCPQT
mmetsp:Transcript_21049/g.30543  ORF Transcript_21049/g.30543 Transcript_21049/m.30543 type:complete len:279 (-) Transcript_21049:73-909(-)|eukprot:CAMPEP_0113940180 /NCGR_PEP_ID=MMETSP1339-20121228/6353_1 /TAXON_ID=94617 /ORGANISM="Fibrocapsa japonica" /LENGTH=278 /DNA_ID=CAMNT_0000943901 /DNA_START=39 /DNA_END=875 /DNA_ORIENTATION=- /assembly_acc=CAM_ASM_000762